MKSPIKQAAAKPGELVIAIAGEAGQGVQSLEAILVSAFKRDGLHVFATKEYMSRVRGGVNSTEIRVSSRPVKAHLDRVDILIPLSQASLPHMARRLRKGSAILGDASQVKHEALIDIPFLKTAEAAGGASASSAVAAGAICGILGVALKTLQAELDAKFASKGPEAVKANLAAAEAGHALGAELKAKGLFKNALKRDSKASGNLLLNGAEAIALGALAGGCNAVFAYPMTPSTSVFTELAACSRSLDIAVEQVEDEIGVMNMSLGAWYAGARAMVSTSGGGFALMTEALSLAGMIESPAVIHLAQRPGPATGLPTRTAQGDLNLALYAGHGFFPRIILAPGSTEEAFELARQAFDLADKLQVPVFLLSDQHFVDSYYDIPSLGDPWPEPKAQIIETSPGYRRYELTRSGISPRGVPGLGSGCVAVDSDEHDEEGRITEDMREVRRAMAAKRMAKAASVRKAALKPLLLSGPKKGCRTLVVSWGSNRNAIEEALELLGPDAPGFLHFPQVHPLHASVPALLKKARRVLCVECNETGQFAEILKLEAGIDIPPADRILKFTGEPFSVEELAREIKARMEG